MPIASLPNPEEKTEVHFRFDNLNVDELAAAGRAVKKGAAPIIIDLIAEPALPH